MLKRIFFWGLFGSIFNVAAAEVEVLPATKHQLFMTFSQFADEQSGIYFRESGNAWAALSGSLALLTFGDENDAPQLVASGNLNLSFRGQGKLLDYAVETFDVRLALAFEGYLTSISPALRYSVGYLHLSGHTADGLTDPSLMPLDMGQDEIVIRLIYDWGNWARVGFTLSPVFSSNPGAQFYAGDQFVEIFPWGVSQSYKSPTPFLALGTLQGGFDRVRFTYNVVAGVYVGNHTRAERTPILRAVIGYYDGIDPRLKYAAYQLSSAAFLYGGLMINF